MIFPLIGVCQNCVLAYLCFQAHSINIYPFFHNLLLQLILFFSSLKVFLIYVYFYESKIVYIRDQEQKVCPETEATAYCELP